MKENLIIARDVRKTIKYIEANIYNFPNNYRDLKTNIINSCYEILRLVYTANIEQEIIYKKKAIVEIKMLNFFLSQALDKELITKKKFLSYERYLENTIRNNFDFTGTPITLQFKNRGSKDEDDE